MITLNAALWRTLVAGGRDGSIVSEETSWTDEMNFQWVKDEVYYSALVRETAPMRSWAL